MAIPNFDPIVSGTISPRAVHRLRTVEAGVFAGVGQQRENPLCRRFDDPLDTDCVSVIRPP